MDKIFKNGVKGESIKNRKEHIEEIDEVKEKDLDSRFFSFIANSLFNCKHFFFAKISMI
jgi:hypothetical protein